jgi:hypothetical protein
MSYSARIHSQSPACFLLLTNMSPSMRKPARDGVLRTCYEECTSAVNAFLGTVVLTCEDGEGEDHSQRIKPYYAAAVVGYTLDTGGKLTLSNLLPQIGTSTFQAVSDLHRTARWTDATGQLIADDLTSAANLMWINPASTQANPISEESLVESITAWRQLYPRGFPPVILHLTDGSQFPSQLQELLEAIVKSTTPLSEPLLFHCVLPRGRHAGNLILPALDAPPFDDLTLLSIWQNSSILPKPIAKLLQGDEEVPERFRCFCLAASAEAASQFLQHVFRLLPPPGTLQNRKHPDLDSIRRTQRETQYKRAAESRARMQDVRTRRAYVLSIFSIVIALLALVFTLLKFFIYGK